MLVLGSQLRCHLVSARVQEQLDVQNPGMQHTVHVLRCVVCKSDNWVQATGLVCYKPDLSIVFDGRRSGIIHCKCTAHTTVSIDLRIRTQQQDFTTQ